MKSCSTNPSVHEVLQQFMNSSPILKSTISTLFYCFLFRMSSLLNIMILFWHPMPSNKKKSYINPAGQAVLGLLFRPISPIGTGSGLLFVVFKYQNRMFCSRIIRYAALIYSRLPVLYIWILRFYRCPVFCQWSAMVWTVMLLAQTCVLLCTLCYLHAF